MILLSHGLEIIITPTLTGTELIFFFREKLQKKACYTASHYRSIKTTITNTSGE
jgi:hypothetical protein